MSSTRQKTKKSKEKVKEKEEVDEVKEVEKTSEEVREEPQEEEFSTTQHKKIEKLLEYGITKKKLNFYNLEDIIRLKVSLFLPQKL